MVQQFAFRDMSHVFFFFVLLFILMHGRLVCSLW